MKIINRYLFVFDIAVGAFSIYLSFLLRFDGKVPEEYYSLLMISMPWFSLTQIIIFYLFGLYARIWRYTSIYDLYAISNSVFFASVISFLGGFYFFDIGSYPRSIYLLYYIFNFILTSGCRLAIRVYYSHYHESPSFKSEIVKKKLLLLGAGKTGDQIAREILTSSRNLYSIAGFIDDDKNKQGALLHGKKVFCGVNEMAHLKIDFDEVLITCPSSTGDQMRRIVKACKQTGKRYKTVPTLNEIIGQKQITLDNVRDVSYSDLLGREEVKLDMNSIENMLNGKRILITGAGGSIGSELVNQCLAFNPAEIICLDIGEEKIYNLNCFIEKNQTKIIIKTVLASVENLRELKKVFIENRPHIVFHAAAYKHVPIQEQHPWIAVRVNIAGTKNMVELSDYYNVEKFVLVSTDKAVNPVNVMGATKRVAEKLIQSFNAESKTCYLSVRFGNVLGSSGSAIPTFQKQIKAGGPITVTHPEMTRYFM